MWPGSGPSTPLILPLKNICFFHPGTNPLAENHSPPPRRAWQNWYFRLRVSQRKKKLLIDTQSKAPKAKGRKRRLACTRLGNGGWHYKAFWVISVRMCGCLLGLHYLQKPAVKKLSAAQNFILQPYLGGCKFKESSREFRSPLSKEMISSYILRF